MAHVSDVLDMVNGVALVVENAPYPVSHEVGTEVAQMGIAVHCWPAGVQAHDARRARRELNDLSFKRVEESE